MWHFQKGVVVFLTNIKASPRPLLGRVSTGVWSYFLGVAEQVFARVSSDQQESLQQEAEVNFFKCGGVELF